MSNFLSIMLEEVKHFLTDKGAMLILFIGITAYAVCYTLPYYNEVISSAPIGIVDMDNTKSSEKFIRNLHSTDALHFTNNYSSIAESEKEFFKGKIKAFIVIPKNFEKDILRGKQTNIALYADSAYLIVYKTIYTDVLETAVDMGAKLEVAKMVKSGVPKAKAISIKKPFEFVTVPLYNYVGGYKSYVYPIILIVIFHQTLIIGLSLMQGTRNEKKIKYCKNLKDIPITILARSTPYICLYLLYGAIGFLIFPQIFAYGMYYNLLPLALIYVLMLYAAAFFAQTLSYFFKIREAGMMLIVPASIVFMFIPGLIWPRESIPFLINIFSFFIPATCGIDGIIKINQNGAGFMNIMYDYFWLLFLCVLYFATAVILTQKSDKRIDDKNK